MAMSQWSDEATSPQRKDVERNCIPYRWAEKLGAVYHDTTIVVMSEFGRTVEENGNRGTEHGHGNVMGLLGGAIQGQQMYGTWSGLADANLNEGRDLVVTTDFRDVLASILGQQWGLNSQQLAQVFPNYQANATLPFFG